MAIRSEQVRQAVQDFDFQRLFIDELGWDNPPTSQSVEVGDRSYDLEAAAEKSGLVAYVCRNVDVPERAVRMKIERQVAKQTHEHLLLFVDEGATRQVWQWVKRQPGRSPLYREHAYHQGQTGEPLIQKLELLAFSLDEEPSIAEVAGRAGRAFDVDRVTKHFYTRFKTEHDAFLEFVEGIPGMDDREWYTSLMLDRLMFVYFVQKKGFLDGDHDYLRNRLRMMQQRRGPDQFLSFYRHFLRRFFHEGLGQRPEDRASDLDDLIGNVPYLNGGIFDVHELEERYPDLRIDDSAFERLFGFFDAYQWHLDERPLRADDEINPDVLGYIFEKYVNQKQMGAYYTKEDITGYIAQNTVIPRLFDMARKDCAIAFRRDSALWRLLSENPDRYIYPAMQKGVGRELPAHVALGVDDVAQRGRWNEPADDAHALPTETWREHVARRQRHDEIWEKLVDGEVHQVNDLITLNLDIRQFAQDVILDFEGPELLRAFWKAIRNVSVLDPACGSGAFLFAALNVLEPLYDACLERMEAFVAELDHSEVKRSPAKFSDFREYLGEVQRHPNRRYFILKSIIIGNLYGVDIMEEAVEICKLRLFLKLAAQADTVDKLEPLPDIDFNVRAGNTLVGFTSLDAVRRAMTVMPDGQYRQVFPEEQEVLDRIEEDARLVGAAFNQFQTQQTMLGGEVSSADKTKLRERLGNLSAELDRYLATEYGIDHQNSDAYADWLDTHQPFHWFVEFYEAVSECGFDVVIGNPPYLARQKVASEYTLKGFQTSNCPDIYALVAERSINVCRNDGRTSMIVPLSLTFSSRFTSLRSHLYAECDSLWFSSFGRIPSALFSFDTRVRNTIYLARKSSNPRRRRFTTRLHRWFDSQRPALFHGLSYAPFSPSAFGELIPKLGNSRLLQGFESLLQGSAYRLQDELAPRRSGAHHLHFKQTAYNWLTFCVHQPPAYGTANRPIDQTQYATVLFSLEDDRDISKLLLNGLLMFTWWIAVGDDFHLTHGNIRSAPLGVGQLTKNDRNYLSDLMPELEQVMVDNLVFKLNAGKKIGNYNLARCRHVTDKIDKVWLEALGLSELWEDIELEHALVVRTSFDDGE